MSVTNSSKSRPSAKFHSLSEKLQRTLNASKLANVSGIKVGTAVIACVDGEEVFDEVVYIEEEDDNIYVKYKAILEEDVSRHSSWKNVEPGRAFRTKDSCRVIIKRDGGSFDELEPISRTDVRSNPQWITDMIKKNRPYSLPIFLNQGVFNAIVAQQIENEWVQPSYDLLDSTAKLMEITAKGFILKMGLIGSLPSLANFLLQKSSDVIETIKYDTKKELQKLLHRECTPYTQNHYLFENVSKLRTERLMNEVLSTLTHHCGTGAKMQQEASPDNLQLAVRTIFETNQKKSVDEHMAEEMQNALDGYGCMGRQVSVISD